MAEIGSFGLDVGIYGSLATPDTVVGLAQQAEAMGFESIWVADHIAFPVTFKSEYPYSAKGDFPSRLSDPLLEPVATMGVLVGATRRVKIGAAVLILPYRNPLLLARMMVTLDQFSGGRMIFGAGTGWLEEEFSALGAYDFKKRGRVTDEYIEIFKAISAGGEVGTRVRHTRFCRYSRTPGPCSARTRRSSLVGFRSRPCGAWRIRQRLAGSYGQSGKAPGGLSHPAAVDRRERSPFRGSFSQLQDVPRHRSAQTEPV